MDPRSETAPPSDPRPLPLRDEDTVLRHHWLRRLEHWLVSGLFVALAVTGLAQRFHEAAWSQRVVALFGGIDATRLVHRGCGLAFSLAFLVHMAVAVVGVLWLKWRPTMLVTPKDFRDALQNLRYYVFLADRPAQCDRYDYRSKFEYWGIVLGGALMIGTGFILWFPVSFFQIFSFLPGETIPAAKTIHSNEALLALSVLVVWHSYNAIFSPEVFPLDTSIFTGRITVARMKHEHPLEYARLMAAMTESTPPTRGAQTPGPGRASR